MQIKDFCEAARKAGWVLNIEKTTEGYAIFAEVGNDVVYIDSQRSGRRRWKRLDVLVKHVQASGFQGDLMLHVSQQMTL